MLFPGGAIEMGFGGVGPKSGECQHGAQDRVQRDSCWCFFYLGTERMRAPGTEQSQSYVSSLVLHFTLCFPYTIYRKTVGLFSIEKIVSLQGTMR